jgi:hypothetical protein
VNTATIMQAQGLCFSISINSAKDIANMLIREGRVRKAYLGISMQDVNLHQRVINFHQLENKKGIFVMAVEKDSPAGKAGLHEGDDRCAHFANSCAQSFFFDYIGSDAVGEGGVRFYTPLIPSLHRSKSIAQRGLSVEVYLLLSPLCERACVRARGD